MFVLKNICNFSNPADIKLFANGNYLRFFISFQSLKGKRKKTAKVYFCDYATSQKNAFKVTPQKFLLLQYVECKFSIWFSFSIFMENMVDNIEALVEQY